MLWHFPSLYSLFYFILLYFFFKNFIILNYLLLICFYYCLLPFSFFFFLQLLNTFSSILYLFGDFLVLDLAFCTLWLWESIAEMLPSPVCVCRLLLQLCTPHGAGGWLCPLESVRAKPYLVSCWVACQMLSGRVYIPHAGWQILLIDFGLPVPETSYLVWKFDLNLCLSPTSSYNLTHVY